MFKITPIQTKEEQERICFEIGISYRPDAFAYKMYDLESGEIMGISQFEISDVGYIFNIKETRGRDDFEAMFILARQTMNFIDLCGAHTCLAREDCAKESFLTAIGFKRQGDSYFCDMTGMFDGNCSGHK